MDKVKRYRVLENVDSLQEGDIITEDDKYHYIYCTDKVCTTIFTIEKNLDKFEPMDIL